MDNNALSTVTFFDGLQILLVGLKLTAKIDWSWLAVTSPLAFSFVAGFIVPPLVRIAARKNFA